MTHDPVRVTSPVTAPPAAVTAPPAPAGTDGHVLRADGPDATDRLLELARRHLGMDVALLTEFADGRQMYRGLAGDAPSFGLVVGEGIPLELSYCSRMVSGEIDHAIPDTALDPVVRDLPVTTAGRIRSYVSVPLTLPDGRLYGALCTLSHAPHPVDDRDARFLSLLAELLAGELDAERERREARDRLGRLIERAELDMALQPIVDLRTRGVIGLEALARFPHPFGTPDLVFAEAERAGVGAPLEHLAVWRAIALVPLLAPHQYLAVNASPAAALAAADLVRGRDDLPYDRLVLEITEHAGISDYTALREGLREVRERGLRLAIDDAGAGFASLAHVVELAPDVIKVDRTFVDGLAGDRARRGVVAAMVALAHETGAHVVAEGVELADDLAAAAHLGVDAAQGYLLDRPSTDPADVARWAATGRG